jgi:hypothetical protein
MRASQEAIVGSLVAALAAIIVVASCVRYETRGPHLFHLSGTVSR